MLLNSITLENIRSYKTESITFPRGITLFEGDIGSGKSTVLMGIEFALFGLGSLKGDGLLSTKAKQGSVKLSFEVDGVPYEIVRKIVKKGKSVSQDSKNCYLIEDGVKEPLAATELKQRILQILKFNEPSESRSESRIYRYAVFTPQEEMKTILVSSEKRLETIRKAFNLEKYKIAAENASDLARTLDKDLIEFKIKFEGLEGSQVKKERLAAEIKNTKNRISKLQAERKNLTKNHATSERKYSNTQKRKSNKDKHTIQLETVLDSICKEKDELERLNEDIDEGNNELQEVSKKIIGLKQTKKPTKKSLKQIGNEIKKYRDLEKKIIDCESRHASELKTIKELSKGLENYLELPIPSLEKEIPILKKRIYNCDQEIEKNEQEKIEHSKNKIQFETKLNDIEEKLANLENVDSKCPICDTKLSATHVKDLEKKHQAEIEKINETLKSTEEKILKLSSTIQEIELNHDNDAHRLDEIETALPALKTLNDKTSKVKKLAEELQKLKSQNVVSEEESFPNKDKLDVVSYLDALKEALNNFLNMSEQVKGLKNNEQKLKNRVKKWVERRRKLMSNIERLEGKQKRIRLQIDKFSKLDDEISKAESGKKNIEAKIINTEKSLSEENIRLANSKQDLEEIIQAISKSEQAKENYEKYSRFQEWIQSFFIKAVNQIETQVMQDIQRRFNETYQNWYSMLIDDTSKESRINEDFTPVLFQDGYYQDLEYLSGGEKTSIALAYRLTLNSMMRQETDSLKSNLLILDEPTDGFSPSQLTKIRTILQELHSQQIILVSHEKELETYVDNIFQVRKDEGVSKVTRIND